MYVQSKTNKRDDVFRNKIDFVNNWQAEKRELMMHWRNKDEVYDVMKSVQLKVFYYTPFGIEKACWA